MTAARSRLASLARLALLAALTAGLPPAASAQALAPLAWMALMAPMPPTAPIDRPAKSLAVQVSRWTFPSRPLAITIDQGGVLAGRHLAIYVFVDGNQIERVTTKADRTYARISAVELSAGPHLLTVRSGSEAAEVKFRVLSWSWVVGGALLLLAALALPLLWFRSARRDRKGS